MKSTRMMELRTTMPAPAMKPIIEVAEKNAPSRPCAGRIPTSENGIADHDDERREEGAKPADHQARR